MVTKSTLHNYIYIYLPKKAEKIHNTKPTKCFKSPILEIRSVRLMLDTQSVIKEWDGDLSYREGYMDSAFLLGSRLYGEKGN